MAFFSDGTSSYMSLSLNPAADKKVYVFKMTERQIFVASKILPFCLATSIIAFFLIAAIGALSKLDFMGGWLNESLQTDIVLLLASLGAVVAFSEFGFFMWVRFSPSSLLSEGKRKRLCHMALYRRLSWMAYAAFFFSLLSPCLGLFVLPNSSAGLGWDAGFLTYFFITQIGFITSLFIAFLVRRILIILSWKGLAKVDDHRVAQ
jgi:hypothetical protein